ncbi:uncharacterized protein LOC110072990 [Pogona vitticeps]
MLAVAAVVSGGQIQKSPQSAIQKSHGTGDGGERESWQHLGQAVAGEPCKIPRSARRSGGGGRRGGGGGDGESRPFALLPLVPPPPLLLQLVVVPLPVVPGSDAPLGVWRSCRNINRGRGKGGGGEDEEESARRGGRVCVCVRAGGGGRAKQKPHTRAQTHTHTRAHGHTKQKAGPSVVCPSSFPPPPRLGSVLSPLSLSPRACLAFFLSVRRPQLSLARPLSLVFFSFAASSPLFLSRSRVSPPPPPPPPPARFAAAARRAFLLLLLLLLVLCLLLLLLPPPPPPLARALCSSWFFRKWVSLAKLLPRTTHGAIRGGEEGGVGLGRGEAAAALEEVGG